MFCFDVIAVLEEPALAAGSWASVAGSLARDLVRKTLAPGRAWHVEEERWEGNKDKPA